MKPIDLFRSIWFRMNDPLSAGYGFTDPNRAMPLGEILNDPCFLNRVQSKVDDYRIVAIAPTLDEWSSVHGVDVHQHDEARWVFQDDEYEVRKKSGFSLWHLTDYMVSSVSGGVIWLAPVVSKEAQF